MCSVTGVSLWLDMTEGVTSPVLIVGLGAIIASSLRLALDHPGAVSRLALLDCIPISEHLSRTTAEFATRWWHWFFFAQPEIPERVINADPDSWYRGDPEAMGRDDPSLHGHQVTLDGGELLPVQRFPVLVVVQAVQVDGRDGQQAAQGPGQPGLAAAPAADDCDPVHRPRP